MKAIQPSKTIPRTNDLDKRVCEPASVHWAVVVVVALVFIRKITTGSQLFYIDLKSPCLT